jgi:hypothetical protein
MAPVIDLLIFSFITFKIFKVNMVVDLKEFRITVIRMFPNGVSKHKIAEFLSVRYTILKHSNNSRSKFFQFYHHIDLKNSQNFERETNFKRDKRKK